MEDVTKEIEKVFGNKLRIRVSGIYLEGNSILLVKHTSLGKKGILWAPPGGGMNFGESAEESLIREFKEETGLAIRVNEFLFVHEYLDPPLHAIELFFHVSRIGGNHKAGVDPELTEQNQIIKEVKFLDFNYIKNEDSELFHNFLTQCKEAKDIFKIKEYIKFSPNI